MLGREECHFDATIVSHSRDCPSRLYLTADDLNSRSLLEPALPVLHDPQEDILPLLFLDVLPSDDRMDHARLSDES